MANSVFPPKENMLEKIFEKRKPIIGVIHSKPLPGAPKYKGEPMDSVYEFAINEAKRFEEGGVDGIIVENGWDIPFAKPEDIGFETVTSMSVMSELVARETSLPIGVNCLANAAFASLTIGKASRSDFIRVNQWCNAYVANEGIIEGRAAQVLRDRARLHADDIAVFADVHVKHGSHSICADRSIGEMTRDAEWFDADVLIATGNRTGDPTQVSEVQNIKESANLPVIIGSGLNIDNCASLMEVADGAIVATSLKKDGVWWNEVDVERVKKLMDIVNSLR